MSRFDREWPLSRPGARRDGFGESPSRGFRRPFASAFGGTSDLGQGTEGTPLVVGGDDLYMAAWIGPEHEGGAIEIRPFQNRSANARIRVGPGAPYVGPIQAPFEIIPVNWAIAGGVGSPAAVSIEGDTLIGASSSDALGTWKCDLRLSPIAPPFVPRRRPDRYLTRYGSALAPTASNELVLAHIPVFGVQSATMALGIDAAMTTDTATIRVYGILGTGQDSDANSTAKSIELTSISITSAWNPQSNSQLEDIYEYDVMRFDYLCVSYESNGSTDTPTVDLLFVLRDPV